MFGKTTRGGEDALLLVHYVAGTLDALDAPSLAEALRGHPEPERQQLLKEIGATAAKLLEVKSLVQLQYLEIV